MHRMEKTDETQKKINGHTAAWLKMGSAGSKHGHEDRFRSTCLSGAVATANMYSLLKDHKDPDPGGAPKSRSVVSDCTGMGAHLSNILSNFLEPISESINDRIDVVSTEDALRHVDEFNAHLQDEPGNFVLIGADAVALYPSIQAATTAKAIGDEVREQCDLDFEEINWSEVAKYIATCVQP